MSKLAVPYVVTAIDESGELVAAEFIEGLRSTALIEAIVRWTSQGYEFRIKRVSLMPDDKHPERRPPE